MEPCVHFSDGSVISYINAPHHPHLSELDFSTDLCMQDSGIQRNVSMHDTQKRAADLELGTFENVVNRATSGAIANAQLLPAVFHVPESSHGSLRPQWMDLQMKTSTWDANVLQQAGCDAMRKNCGPHMEDDSTLLPGFCTEMQKRQLRTPSMSGTCHETPSLGFTSACVPSPTESYGSGSILSLLANQELEKGSNRWLVFTNSNKEASTGLGRDENGSKQHYLGMCKLDQITGRTRNPPKIVKNSPSNEDGSKQPQLISGRTRNFKHTSDQIGLRRGKKLSEIKKHRFVPPRCQIPGCNADLSTAGTAYHRKHKVCRIHSKAAKVTMASGIEHRFCQQCSRFHVLSEFDERKRSCRRRLADHNERRRKPTQGDKRNSLTHSLGKSYLKPHSLHMPFFTNDKRGAAWDCSSLQEFEEHAAMVSRVLKGESPWALSLSSKQLLMILQACILDALTTRTSQTMQSQGMSKS